MSSKWGALIQKCFNQRCEPSRLASYCELLQKDVAFDGQTLSSHILKHGCGGAIDPLIPVYVETLIAKGLVSPHEVLQALLELRPSPHAADEEEAFSESTRHVTNGAPLEQAVLIIIAREFARNATRHDSNSGKRLFASLTAWMIALVSQSADIVIQSAMASSQEVMQAVMITRESFATLLITCMENNRVREDLKTKPSQDTIKQLAEAFASFTALMMNNNLTLADRLQMLQKDLASLQYDEAMKMHSPVDGAAISGQLQLESIVDSEPTNTRAGFAIYLDSLLEGRPQVSDALLFAHLQTRYKGDTSTSFADFLTACFDALAISISRHEATEKSFIHRSFLVNKAPAILLYLSSTSFVPMENEFLISQSLSRLDPSAFTTYANEPFLGSQNNLMVDTRRQFLCSCVLHGLLSFDGVDRILGEQITHELPDGGRAQKQQLVDECKGNPQRIDNLIQGTESFDGNATPRVEALAEIFNLTCASRDKVALKSLCYQLLRRPQTLDALALYTEVYGFLQPLCMLLLEWKYDDEEGEHQPIYDEFSACLLLLVAMVQRFRLSSQQLGFSLDQPFWHALLTGTIEAKSLVDLTEDQNKRLSEWIGSLFVSNGLGDEVLASCPPQEFYMLAPTLFQQTIMACKLSTLSTEHLKNGLELLLESFLMPALIPSLLWLMKNAQEHDDERNVFFVILEKVIKPQSLNGEAVNMHPTMLSILADHLLIYLNDLKKRNSENQQTVKNIQQLVDILQGHVGYCKAGEAHVNQLQLWTSGNFHAILDHLRSMFGSLCFWTTSSGLQASVPTYSQSMVSAAIHLMGAEATLNAIVEETNSQSAPELKDAALDIATTMVFNDATHSNQSEHKRISLRDTLQLQMADAPRLLASKDSDHPRIETSVRLARRVETLLTNIAAASAQHQQQQTITMPMSDSIIQDIELDAATAAAVGLGTEDEIGQAADAAASHPLDFTGGAGDLQLDLDEVLASQPQQGQDGQIMTGVGGDQGQQGDEQMPATTEDDIFGDLMVDDDFNF